MISEKEITILKALSVGNHLSDTEIDTATELLKSLKVGLSNRVKSRFKGLIEQSQTRF